ncbi:MAG: hypothetical protein ABI867_37765 [Kofleriaceae bacterium]
MRRLVVQFGMIRIAAEPGLRLEVDSTHDWALEEVITGLAGRIESLALRGRPELIGVRPQLLRMLAAIPVFEPSPEWTEALRTDRDPTPRARPA